MRKHLPVLRFLYLALLMNLASFTFTHNATAQVNVRPAAPAFPFDAETAKSYQKRYAEWAKLPVGFEGEFGAFVLIPPGTFPMGSPANESGRGGGNYDEALHEVTLTEAFYLGKHEVTFGQFRRFVEATGYKTDGEKNGGGNAHDDKAVWKHRLGTHWKNPGFAGPFKQRDEHPVVHVSLADALAYCKWLGEKKIPAQAKRYDLPTEAQWEWACRAGSGTRFWWGEEDDKSGKVANVGDQALKAAHPEWPRAVMPMNDGHAFLAPVGSFRANAFGLYDMIGNVWEFCATKSGPYPRRPATNPSDLDAKRGYAVRGGGWSNVAADCRCATRNADPPHFCHSNLGFRVAIPLK